MRKADVVAAANGRKARPSTSDSYRHLSEENHQLRRANEGLTQHNQHLTQQQEVDHELIMMLFAELGKEPLGHLLRRRQQVQAQFQVSLFNNSAYIMLIELMMVTKRIDGGTFCNWADLINVDH